jgi:flagellar hook assembly protein FlgD
MDGQVVLERNRPNPFDGSTQITFKIRFDAYVELRIFNNGGSLLRTLLSADHKAGQYTIDWDGNNYRGLPVPSGVYFYRVRAGNMVVRRLSQKISVSLKTDVIPSISRPPPSRLQASVSTMK